MEGVYTIVVLSNGMESIYSSFEFTQKTRADEAWSDFGQMWLSSDEKAKSFVAEFLSGELSISESDCKRLLDELNLVHRNRAQKHRSYTHTYVKTDIKVSDALGEVVDKDMTDSSSVRYNMIENLVRIKSRKRAQDSL